MILKYYIKDYHDDKDWQEIETCFDKRFVAKTIAESLYNEDPCDPDEFECVIIFENGDIYDCFAELSVDFYSYKREK